MDFDIFGLSEGFGFLYVFTDEFIFFFRSLESDLFRFIPVSVVMFTLLDVYQILYE